MRNISFLIILAITTTLSCYTSEDCRNDVKNFAKIIRSSNSSKLLKCSMEKSVANYDSYNPSDKKLLKDAMLSFIISEERTFYDDIGAMLDDVDWNRNTYDEIHKILIDFILTRKSFAREFDSLIKNETNFYQKRYFYRLQSYAIGRSKLMDEETYFNYLDDIEDFEFVGYRDTLKSIFISEIK